MACVGGWNVSVINVRKCLAVSRARNGTRLASRPVCPSVLVLVNSARLSEPEGDAMFRLGTVGKMVRGRQRAAIRSRSNESDTTRQIEGPRCV